MKLIKTTVTNVKNFQDNKFDIDFFAIKQTSEAEKRNRIVTPVIKSFNLLNSLALIGVNASGKTTLLNFIITILEVFIEGKSLNEISFNLSDYIDGTLRLENYFFNEDEKILYKVVSEIKKQKNDLLYFSDEKIYKKSINSRITRHNLMEDFKLSQDRKEVFSKFKDLRMVLKKDDDTLFQGRNSTSLRTSPIPFIIDLTRLTNNNYLGYFTNEIDASFVNYLDENLELIEYDEEKKQFKIKFKNSEEIIEGLSLSGLETYLSSGTIRGITLLLSAQIILANGGYLIVDEIENHLNKLIVTQIISLFNSRYNMSGATLIFSTHYSEIIDSISRTDSIFTLKKNRDIIVRRFSDVISTKDRMETKKSQLIIAGLLGLGTSPKYLSEKKMRNGMAKGVEKLQKRLKENPDSIVQTKVTSSKNIVTKDKGENESDDF